MSRRLEDLDERFRPLAEDLLRHARKLFAVTIIDTLRTPEEHADNLKRGVSWVKRSKHMDGLAIDLCPTALLKQKGWAPLDPAWATLGLIGESLGLRWGGRWKVKDLGHFEWREPR